MSSAQREAVTLSKARRIKPVKLVVWVLPLCVTPVPAPRNGGAEAGQRWGSSGELISLPFLSSHPFVQAEGPLAATSWRGGP